MTKKRLLAAFAAIAAAAFLASCASTTEEPKKQASAAAKAAPAKTAPKAQPQKKPAAGPSKTTAVPTPAPAATPAAPAETPEPVPAEPAPETPAAAPAEIAPAVAPAETPAVAPAETVPAAEPEVPAVEAPAAISFRCAYARRPSEKQDFYVKKDGEFKRIDIFELSFPAVHRLDTPVAFYVKKGENDYRLHTTINTADLDDCASIIMPEGEIYTFDVSPESAPIGAVVIGNFWRKAGISGKITFRVDGHVEDFTLAYGESYISTAVRTKDSRERICDVELSITENGEQKILYSSSGALINDSACTFLWAIPRDALNPEGVPPDFRSFRIFRKK